MEKYIAIFAEALQTIIILAGVVWAIWRFRIELPTKPRIELDVDAKFFGPQQGQYIIGINIQVRNKGTVSHTIDRLELNIRGIKPNGSVLPHPDEDMEQRVNFPEKIFRSNNIIYSDYKYYFIRAGVQQTIFYHTAVPEDIRFVRVWAAFHYRGMDENHKHTVERIFEVKAASST